MGGGGGVGKREARSFLNVSILHKSDHRQMDNGIFILPLSLSQGRWTTVPGF